MHTARHKRSFCPACKHEIDSATHLDLPVTPEVGDIAVCVYCGSINTFVATDQLRCATKEEINALDPQVRYDAIHLQWMILYRQAGRPQ